MKYSFLPTTIHPAPPVARASTAIALALALGALCAACGDGEAASGSTSGTPPIESICADDPRATAYAAGLERASADASVKVRFVNATPSPPTKGDNIFTIQVLDSGGSPIDGATVTTTSKMPDHGHSSAVIPETTPAGVDGKYTISPVNFFMAGIWEATFTIERAGAPTETVTFTFCIDG